MNLTVPLSWASASSVAQICANTVDRGLKSFISLCTALPRSQPFIVMAASNRDEWHSQLGNPDEIPRRLSSFSSEGSLPHALSRHGSDVSTSSQKMNLFSKLKVSSLTRRRSNVSN